MPDVPWLLPVGVALVVVLFLAAVTVLVVRVRRRSPAARAAAREARVAAERALLELDDAVDDLDVAIEAADAVGSDAPDALRRSRAAVARTRDRGFGEVSALRAPQRVPAEARADALRIRARLASATEEVARIRAELAAWTTANRTIDARTAAASRRLADVRTAAGDPARLIDALARRFAAEDWADAASAERAAMAAATEARTALDGTPLDGTAPHHTVAADDARLHRATAATRDYARHLRALEEAHRISLQASDNAEAEVAAARREIAAAQTIIRDRARVGPDAAARLDRAVGAFEEAAADPVARPRAAVEAVARLRDDVDTVLSGAMTSRERLDAARAALPGTLATARATLATVEGRAVRGPLEARLRREQARRELAAARAATDPVSALVAARAAWSDAVDAAAP